MNFPEIYSATGMMELIQEIGFLPLLDSGIEGFSARFNLQAVSFQGKFEQPAVLRTREGEASMTVISPDWKWQPIS